MVKPKQYYIYMLSNENKTVIYTGVTNDLKKRIYEHKNKLCNGFTKKYNITKLLYYEVYDNAYNAIMREKQIKGGSRKRKTELINTMNPKLLDLYEEL